MWLHYNEQNPSWASYQIRKIAGCACAGNAGNVFPRRRFQMKPLVSDPGMHHGTCVTHVPWCMSGSLTCGDGENVPGIPGACAPAISRIWQEVHKTSRRYLNIYTASGWIIQPNFLTHPTQLTEQCPNCVAHDDVIKWKHFPRNWPSVQGIHRSRWIPHTKTSDAELWCFLWLRLNKRLSEAGDLRRCRAHYGVTLMGGW